MSSHNNSEEGQRTTAGPSSDAASTTAAARATTVGPWAMKVAESAFQRKFRHNLVSSALTAAATTAAYMYGDSVWPDNDGWATTAACAASLWLAPTVSNYICGTSFSGPDVLSTALSTWWASKVSGWMDWGTGMGFGPALCSLAGLEVVRSAKGWLDVRREIAAWKQQASSAQSRGDASGEQATYT